MLPDRVVVHGSAGRDVAPDVAVLRAVVVEVDADRRQAFERCGSRVASLIPALRTAVGDDGDVTTGQVSLDRYFGAMDEKAPPRYAASCVVAAECPPARATDVIAAAVTGGSNELTGPRYSVRDRTPLTEDLLDEAVEAARRKAQRLARAAGRRLGAVLAIEEGGLGRSDLPSIDVYDDPEMTVALSAPAARVELQPAHVRVTVSVRVAFALGDPHDDAAATGATN
jgi:uncharacterized protein YggE